jgi:membrane-bound ClpP family serine protease
MQAEGWAHVRGETWRVVSPVPLARNQKIRVASIDGLTLGVVPLSDAGMEPRAERGVGATPYP